jgi:hypothetical protein
MKWHWLRVVPWKKLGVGLLGVVAVSFIVLVTLQTSSLGLYGPALRKKQQRLLSLTPEYMRIQRLFSNLDVYQVPNNNGQDAGDFLNPIVRWPLQCGSPEYLEHPPAGPLRVSSDWQERLKARIDIQNFDKWDFKGIDLSWLTKLKQFDYWDLSHSNSQKTHYNRLLVQHISAIEYFRAVPYPAFADLFQFGQLRLMQGLKQRKMKPALEEVRHLAKLLYSTESLNGMIMSAAMLVAEEKAYQLAVEKRILAKGDWTPVTDGLNLLNGGLISVLPQYGAYTPEEVLVHTIANPKNSVGRCVAIQEGLPRLSRLIPLVSKKWPLERSMDDVLGRLKQIALDPNNGCRLRFVREYWQTQDTLLAEMPGELRLSAFQSLPYVRRIVANKWISNP